MHGGGFLSDPLEKKKSFFNWGLGVMDNNQAKVYPLFLGFEFEKGLYLKQDLIFWESIHVIKQGRNHITIHETIYGRI